MLFFSQPRTLLFELQRKSAFGLSRLVSVRSGWRTRPNLVLHSCSEYFGTLGVTPDSCGYTCKRWEKGLPDECVSERSGQSQGGRRGSRGILPPPPPSPPGNSCAPAAELVRSDPVLAKLTPDMDRRYYQPVARYYNRGGGGEVVSPTTPPPSPSRPSRPPLNGLGYRAPFDSSLARDRLGRRRSHTLGSFRPSPEAWNRGGGCDIHSTDYTSMNLTTIVSATHGSAIIVLDTCLLIVVIFEIIIIFVEHRDPPPSRA